MKRKAEIASGQDGLDSGLFPLTGRYARLTFAAWVAGSPLRRETDGYLGRSITGGCVS